jgi:hypothetical protein
MGATCHQLVKGRLTIQPSESRLAASALKRDVRPPAFMVALHVWSHGIASLFGRGDAGRRQLPMPPEELLEAGVLVYLRRVRISRRQRRFAMIPVPFGVEKRSVFRVLAGHSRPRGCHLREAS